MKILNRIVINNYVLNESDMVVNESMSKIRNDSNYFVNNLGFELIEFLDFYNEKFK